jgi:RNA polymerase sigma-70 factor (ECF subfamily)
LAEAERARLLRYIEHFNARDFDTVRDMLADDVRLDLVNRARLRGRAEVGKYYHAYAAAPTTWRPELGYVEGRPAILMLDPNDLAGRPAFFILIEWAGDKVAGIRDFHFARYAVEDAHIRLLAHDEP